jgi:hypothetical protein
VVIIAAGAHFWEEVAALAQLTYSFQGNSEGQGGGLAPCQDYIQGLLPDRLYGVGNLI